MGQSLGSLRQRGVSLIEVLVTILILAIGLLGMAGLQVRLQHSEMEAYQRSQALLLLNDMANRIATNRGVASTYATGLSPLGTSVTCPSTTTTQRDRDLREWCRSLKGAAEVLSSSRVGAMVGGRGCVEDLGSGSYRVSVVWQGLTPISAPPTELACGQDLYDQTGTNCQGDMCRRIVSTIVRVADLK